MRLPAVTAAPAMHHFGIAEGLPSMEVYCVFQDSHGKIWFGTDVGVTCYDGVVFRNFTRKDNLPDRTVFRISEDRNGRIWFRCYNGLLSWFDGQRIIQAPVNKELAAALKGQLVISEELDDNDTLWIGVKGTLSGLLKIPPGYSRIVTVPVPSNLFYVKEVRSGHFVTSQCNLVVGQVQLFLDAVSFPGKNLGPVDQLWPFSVARTSASTLALQMGKDRLLVTGKQTQLLHDSTGVTFILPEVDGSYWLCGVHPGSARLVRPANSGEKLLWHYLDGYDVSGCLRDHEGGLWFTTLDNGVFYLPFPDLHESYALALEPGDFITAVTRYPDNGVLSGTYKGRLFLTHNGSCTPWSGSGYNTEKYICCMSTLGRSLLIGGTPTILYNTETHRTTTLLDPLQPRTNLALKCAMVYDSLRWCCATAGQLVWIDHESGKVSRLLDRLPERVGCMARGQGDTIWLGGLSRLWMLIPGQVPVDWSSRFPLLARQADELLCDTANGRLWIVSRGYGIFLLNGTGVSELSAKKDALPLIGHRLLLKDDALWFSTTSGIWSIAMQDSAVLLKQYDQSNGLPVDNAEQFCLSGNAIWVTAGSQLFRFDPWEFPVNIRPPQLCFRGVFCNGLPVALTADELPSFSSNENTFNFRLAAQTYKSFGHTTYLVRLSGADEWHQVQDPDLTYYNLPPGNYEFIAYALNNSGITSTVPVRYTFSVLPPFWRTIWFRCLVLLVLLAALVILVRNSRRRFRKEETYRRNLAELEITAIRAQMNPHFIFNAINSIYHFVLTADRKNSALYVARFARLIRNVLEFASLKKITLQQELETLQLYMDIEQLRFRKPFHYSITVDPALDPAVVEVVPLLLQPYVENAIWHGLSPKEGSGTVSISISQSGNRLVCMIDDDGVGRSATKIPLSGLPKQPMSSRLNQRRLELFRERYRISPKITYIDKQHADGTGAGTCVVINIPQIQEL